MNRQILAKICEQIYQRFPQVAGSQPKVQPRPDQQVLLVFRGVALTADGHTLTQSIRVVVNPDGKIIKITSSH